MGYNLRKRGREPVTDTGEDNTQDVDGDGIGPAPAKRVKDSKSKLARKTTTTPLPPIPRVRRKGSLQDLPKMPLDIIDEILTYMHLDDLLSLSRTTKAFRELVWNKDAGRFWDAAMKNSVNDGLPPCPEWLTKPAYANLMYSPHCHHCFTTNIQTVFFVWGVRYCKKCQEGLLIPEYGHHGRRRDYRVVDMALTHTLRVSLTAFEKRRYHYAALGYKEVRYLLKSEVDDLNDIAVNGLVTKQWSEERKIIMSEKTKWARACLQWHERRLEDRQNEIKKAKNQRLEAVIAKLKELGWQEELNFMADAPQYEPHPLMELKQIRQPRPLTERTWLSMEEDTIAFMDRYKTNRLGRQYFQMLQGRYLQMKAFYFKLCRDMYMHWAFPSARDLAALPAFKAILDAPEDVKVTTESFEALRGNITEYIAEFKLKQETAISQWIENKTGLKLGSKVNIFELAITSQARCRCRRSYLVDSHFSHTCTDWTYDKKDEIDWKDENARDIALNNIAGACPWELQDPELPWEVLEYLIKCAGGNPATTTAAEMDQKPIRWICNGECKSESARIIMDWRAVVEHTRYYGHDPNPSYKTIFPVAKAAEAKQVAPLEQAIFDKDKNTRSLHGIYSCLRCPENARVPMCQKSSVEKHLKTWHNISEPQEADSQLLHLRQEYDYLPFYILVKPSKGSRKGAAYHQAQKQLELADNCRAVIGTLSTYR